MIQTIGKNRFLVENVVKLLKLFSLSIIRESSVKWFSLFLERVTLASIWVSWATFRECSDDIQIIHFGRCSWMFDAVKSCDFHYFLENVLMWFKWVSLASIWECLMQLGQTSAAIRECFKWFTLAAIHECLMQWSIKSLEHHLEIVLMWFGQVTLATIGESFFNSIL